MSDEKPPEPEKKKKPRIITVVLHITDHDQAQAIWEAHRDNKLLNGAHVTCIANGDLSEQLDIACDEINELAQFYADKSGDDWDSQVAF